MASPFSVSRSVVPDFWDLMDFSPPGSLGRGKDTGVSSPCSGPNSCPHGALGSWGSPTLAVCTPALGLWVPLGLPSARLWLKGETHLEAALTGQKGQL